MKKFLAILFSVVILATFMAVPTFAAESPEGELVYSIDVITYANGEASKGSYEVDGDTIILTVSDSEYNFSGWVISGTEGVDYEIVSGDLNSDKLVIRPLADLKIEETFDITVNEGEDTETPDDEGVDSNKNESDKAPQTGNGMLTVVSLLTAGAFVLMVATKKAVRA